MAVIELEIRGFSGLDVVHAVKRAHRRAAVIVITAFDYAGARRAMASGADACLRKPFHAEDLLQCIDQLANRNGSGRPHFSAISDAARRSR